MSNTNILEAVKTHLALPNGVATQGPSNERNVILFGRDRWHKALACVDRIQDLDSTNLEAFERIFRWSTARHTDYKIDASKCPTKFEHFSWPIDYSALPHALAIVDAQYHWGTIGGKQRAIQFNSDGLVISGKDDFNNMFLNRLVEVSEGAYFPIGKLWLEHSERVNIDEVYFKPNAPERIGGLNLWRGFAVKPDGTKKWPLLEVHLKEVICDGNEGHYIWLMCWLAHMVQRPEEKAGSAVALYSNQKGTGKSTLLQVMRRIFGHHAMTTNRVTQVTGNFNSRLGTSVFVGMDECLWGGRGPDADAMKALITEPRVTIERKGIDSVEVDNYSRFLMTSNEWLCAPVTEDERRYLVLEVNSKHMHNPAYFDSLYKEIDNGGVEGFLHALLDWKWLREDVNLRRAPLTPLALRIINSNLSGFKARMLDIVIAGVVNATSLSEVAVTRLETDLVWYAFEGLKELSSKTKLTQMLEAEGYAKKLPGVRTRPNGLREYVYEFPPLPILRKLFKLPEPENPYFNSAPLRPLRKRLLFRKCGSQGWDRPVERGATN